MERKHVAVWRTRGKDYLILYRDAHGYGYTGRGCGGYLGTLAGDDEAIETMERGAVAVLASDRPSLRRVA